MLAYALLFSALALDTLAQSSSFAAFSGSFFASESSFAAFPSASSGAFFGSGSSSAPPAAETTVSFFAPDTFGFGGFEVGSVVNADGCETTFAVHCRPGQIRSGVPCDPNKTGLLTVGVDTFAASDTLVVGGQKTQLMEACTVTQARTLGACSTTLVFPDGTTSTMSDSMDGFIATMPVTAGADKLSNLPVCTASADAAALRAISEVYKVIIVPAAAALIGAALL